MSKYKKLILKILSSKLDKNISFESICSLLNWLGFESRTKGSHIIFRKAGITKRINLQKDHANAKPYQIKQIRQLFVDYGIFEDFFGDDDE